MKELSFGKIFSCAKNEYIKWILDYRMILIIVVQIFILNFVINPLETNAKIMGEPLNCLEPFIAITNSGLILLIMPLVFMTLISDFPSRNANSMYYTLRVGRSNWVLGQIVALGLMVISFMLTTFICSIIPILFESFFGNQWSLVVTDFARKFPKYSYNYGSLLIKENIYYHGNVVNTAFLSFILNSMFLFLIGLILIFFTLIDKRKIGLVICIFVIGGGSILCSIDTKIEWIFPTAHSLIVPHHTKYFSTDPVTIGTSIVYFCSLICVIIISCFGVKEHINFYNIDSND